MKEIKYLKLFDLYSPLLTDNQKAIFEAYYCFDLSLSEIAAEKGVTRQSVADALKKTRAELDLIESKLAFLQKLSSISAFAETLSEDKKNELDRILEK